MCNGSACQPAGPTVVFSEDFESITWDQFGQGTLSDGIAVWDVGGPALRTRMGAGAGTSAKSLTWYGGGVAATPSSATMTLPPILDAQKNVTLKFDGFSAVAVNLGIIISRVGCPAVNQSISSSGWTSYTVSLPACGTSSRIVFQVGAVYAYSSGSQALKIDNIQVSYP